MIDHDCADRGSVNLANGDPTARVGTQDFSTPRPNVLHRGEGERFASDDCRRGLQQAVVGMVFRNDEVVDE